MLPRSIKKIYHQLLFTMTFMLIVINGYAQTSKTDNDINQNLDSIKLVFESQRLAIAEKISKANVYYILKSVDKGKYGYYIFIDEQMIVDQSSIPAVSGNNGFISKIEAEKTALFAINKIKEGYMLPTITIEDLEKLNITFIQ